MDVNGGCKPISKCGHPTCSNACKPATIALELSPQLVLSFADGGNENDINIYIYMYICTPGYTHVSYSYIYIDQMIPTSIYHYLSSVYTYMIYMYVHIFPTCILVHSCWV